MSQRPSIGRIVHYKLGPQDVERVEAQRKLDPDLLRGNSVEVGQVYPALVVRAWEHGTHVNLQVFLDGNDSLWSTSRGEGDDVYQWAWPTRD